MYRMTYLSDGLQVKGYLVMPQGVHFTGRDLKSWTSRYYGASDLPVTEIACSLQRETHDVGTRKWPVFLYCRGGIGKVGSVKPTWLEQFSRHGHIVFAPCYRGSEGGEGRDEFGGSDVEDVVSACRFLASLPFVDENRISVMGFSRGSVNATQAVIRDPLLHRLILWGGVSDLAQTYEERIELRRMLKRVIGGSPAKKPEAYQARSPLFMADRIACPILIMHGTEDAQVDFSHGQNMYNKLRETGANPAFHRYEGYGHHLPQAVHEAAISRMFDWIETPG